MQAKKGRIILAFSVLFLLVNFVAAIDTDIKIKTMPAHEVGIAIGESTGGSSSWEFFKETSDEYGDVTFVVSTNEEEFDLNIEIKKDGERVIHSSFDNPYKSGDNIAGEAIYLELYPSWFTPIESSSEEVIEDNETEVIEDNEEELLSSSETEAETEETENEETEVTEEDSDKNKELTGSSVAEEHSSSSKTFYYGLGFIGLLMISFISFIATKKVRKTEKKKGKEKLDKILDEMDSKGKPKKKKTALVEDVKKKMKEIEDEMEELKKD